MRCNRLAAIGVQFLGVLLGVALAEAYEVSTGPVRLHENDDIAYIVANVANVNVNTVTVKVLFRAANGSGIASATKISPDETCAVDSGGPAGDFAAFCQVTYPSGSSNAD